MWLLSRRRDALLILRNVNRKHSTYYYATVRNAVCKKSKTTLLVWALFANANCERRRRARTEPISIVQNWQEL